MKRRRRDGGSRGFEENIMAIIDTSGFSNSKISHHLDDDRLALLEAVRTTSLIPDNGSAPTWKMLGAIFDILNDADSIDLITQSYQLLVELEKRFPRVYLSEGEESDSSTSISEYIVVDEAWSPFNLGTNSYNLKGDASNHSRSLVDSPGFHSLIQEIDCLSKEIKSGAIDVEVRFLKKMLLLQYIVTVLEGDFLPRNCAYQENVNWAFLRESLLNMLLGSRKITYKELMNDTLSIMCNLSQSTVSSEENSCNDQPKGELQQHEVNRAMVLALPEVEKSTCNVLKKFFLMITELDFLRKAADQHGLTTRVDGTRTPLMDIILDKLTYENDDVICSFLKLFDPKWRLEIIVQYFQKYFPKVRFLIYIQFSQDISQHSVQTRRSSSTVDTDNLDGLLKCLSNSKSTRSIIKKIRTEVIQLLLAYAFQAYLVLSYNEDSVVEVCKSIVSAFTCLQQEDPDADILCSGKQALVTAAAIISTKS